MAAKRSVVGDKNWKASDQKPRRMPRSYRSIGGRDIKIENWKFYAVNQSLDVSGKMSSNGVFDTFEEAAKKAHELLRNYVTMRFEYLLPVLVVQAPNKTMATLPLMAEGNFDRVERRILWINGKETDGMRVGEQPTSKQLKFDAPGFARAARIARKSGLAMSAIGGRYPKQKNIKLASELEKVLVRRGAKLVGQRFTGVAEYTLDTDHGPLDYIYTTPSDAQEGAWVMSRFKRPPKTATYASPSGKMNIMLHGDPKEAARHLEGILDQIGARAPGNAGLSRSVETKFKRGPARSAAVDNLRNRGNEAYRSGRMRDAEDLQNAAEAEELGIDTRNWELPGFAIGSRVGSYKFDRGMTERQKVGALMQQYHGSMGDPYYAVGSYFYAGQRYPKREIVEQALDQVNGDLRRAKSGAGGWGKQEVLELTAIKKYLELDLAVGNATASKNMKITGLSTGREIRVGDTLWFTTPHGTKSGVVKLIGPNGPVVALARKFGGGPAGTPVVVDEKNILQVVKGKRPTGAGRLER